MTIPAISVLWAVLIVLAAIAVYRQLRSHKELRQSLSKFATSHDRLEDCLGRVIRRLEEALSRESTSERPKPSQSSVGAVTPVLDEVFSKDDAQKACQAAFQEIKKQLGTEIQAVVESEGWPMTVPEDKITRLIHRFTDTIKHEESAGYVTMDFLDTVLCLIGNATSLSKTQRGIVERLCWAINDRPLPTALWADFVRKRLEQPATVKRILELCRNNSFELQERVQRQVRAYFRRREGHPRTIVILGFSQTILGVLEGLQDTAVSDLRIFAANLPGRGFHEGNLLKERIDGLNRRFKVEKVLEPADTSERIREKQFDLIIMGCTVIGLRKTGILEVVNSYDAFGYVDAARGAGTPVGVVAGSYKLWPTVTYERYRPAIKVERSDDLPRNSIVEGDLIKWIMTEERVLDVDDFKKEYGRSFTADGIPLAAIRECLRKKKQCRSEEATALAAKVVEELKVDGRELEDLPAHFTEAQRYYEKKKKDEEWLEMHLGKHVAIIGEQVVDSDAEFHKLAGRVRRDFGYGPLFMPLVTKGPRVVYLGPRIKAE